MKEWLVFVGLTLDFFGAVFVGWGSFFITPDTAVWLGAPRWGGTTEQMLNLPQVQNILAEARATRIGMGLVSVGFALQAVASWPGLPGGLTFRRSRVSTPIRKQTL